MCLVFFLNKICLLGFFFCLFPANEDEKEKQAGPDAERHGLKRQRDEKEEHGRAYFEFREEAYNSR